VGTIVSFIFLDTTFIYWYFIVGGWQVISMLVHAVSGWFTRKKSRRYYHWTVAIIIVMGILAFIMPYLLFIYYIMLFAAPVMAICYTFMCYQEVKELKKNHALALK
jgi:hypothetical protein